MYEKTYPQKRFLITLDFLQKHLSTNEVILDLGVSNPLSHLMKEKGFEVINTNGEDLDDDCSVLNKASYQAVTAFEIVEHLLNPYTILKNVQADKVFISVPLRLWFAKAYQSKTDPWDRHYHEFETWQLDWLLQKAGFEIVDSIKFTHPVKKFGIRPLLRWFTPRYYLVYAKKVNSN